MCPQQRNVDVDLYLLFELAYTIAEPWTGEPHPRMQARAEAERDGVVTVHSMKDLLQPTNNPAFI